MSICVSVCLSVSVPVCVSVYTITQQIIGLIHLKLDHIVEYKKNWKHFDIGHCSIKVKVTAPFTTL